MNLQWTCRLFLEMREQLYTLHDGKPSEGVLVGLREELNVIKFRRLQQEALEAPKGEAPPPGLVRFLRVCGRRVLHSGRSRGVEGVAMHEQFTAICNAHPEARAFGYRAVPKLLQLFTRVIEEEGRGGRPCSQPQGQDAAASDPWLDSPGSSSDGESYESSCSSSSAPTPAHGRDKSAMAGPQPGHGRGAAVAAAAPRYPAPAVAYAPAATAAVALQMPAAAAMRMPAAAAPQAAPQMPVPAPQVPLRPPPQAHAQPEAPPAPQVDLGPGQQRRFPAKAPYYAGDASLTAQVAKIPLPDLDGLVGSLVPGAELASEGVLGQLADDELLMMAYALEQIEQAASKRLVKELEVREDLRSTCLHRREYLSLLESTLNHGAV